jgi:hypothetical protein
MSTPIPNHGHWGRSDPLREPDEARAERIAAQIDSADPDERIQAKLARIEGMLDEMHRDGTPMIEPAPSLDAMGGPLDVEPFAETEQAVRWGVEYMIQRAKLADALEQKVRRLEQALAAVVDGSNEARIRGIAADALDG